VKSELSINYSKRDQSRRVKKQTQTGKCSLAREEAAKGTYAMMMMIRRSASGCLYQFERCLEVMQCELSVVDDRRDRIKVGSVFPWLR